MLLKKRNMVDQLASRNSLWLHCEDCMRVMRQEVGGRRRLLQLSW